MFQFAIGLICIILLPTSESKLVLVLTPKNPMARVGERLVLTCSASECAGDVTFTWQSLKHRPLYGRMEKNNTASQQIFDPVGMQHEGKVSCVATCADPKDKAQRSASVEVYAFPKDPIISGSELLTEGQDSDLTCIVPDVYPADRLKVQWLLGDKVLKDDKALNPVIKGEAQTVTSVLKYKPTAQDHGQNVTCRATLDIKNEPETRETVASITVQYSPRDVHISENIQVNIGESFTLTCQAKGHPEPTVLWRKLEKGGLSVMVGDGETLRVKETSWSHDGDYECMSHNTVGNLTAQVTVNVQGLPGKPVLHLSPSGELKEGDSVTISCQSECGSRGRVSLRQVAGGQGAELQSSLGNASITIQSLTVRDSGRYECDATNPSGNMTSTINVTVRAPPRYLSVEVFPSTKVEEGQNVSLRIWAVGVPLPSVTLIRLQDSVEPHSPNGTLNLINMGPEETGQYLLNLNNLGPDQTGQYLLNLTNVGPDQMGQYLLNLNNLGPEQTGQYLLNLTNEVGHQSHHFSLSVQSKTRLVGPDWYHPKTVVIPAVGLVSIATAAGFLIRFLKKRNSYETSRVV